MMQGDPQSEVVHFVRDPALQKRIDRLAHLLIRRLLHKLYRADVQHVGSSAVPGSLTKGDLDLCVRVPERDLELAYSEIARILGCAGTVISGTLQQFSTDIAGIPVGVQLVLKDGPEDFFVHFRDLLREDDELRESYESLKHRYEGKRHTDYRAEKAYFIQRILQMQPPPSAKGWTVGAGRRESV